MICGTLVGALFTAACGDPKSGPVVVSAIGSAPRLVNPNLQPFDAPSAQLLLATAQGLLQLNAGGEIEPALAQSWIVSDDGLRYTFRLGRAQWRDGSWVTAEQVAGRLIAASSSASRNPVKPLLGAIDVIVAMTDDVLEIGLKTPRPNFLQLLAQAEMAIFRDGGGTGPYHAIARPDGALSLHLPEEEQPLEEGGAVAPEQDEHDDAILFRGERAALAVARFVDGRADLVVGGRVGDLPIARAARINAGTLRFDPAAGMFGLAFLRREGALEDAALRRALSMAIDRSALVAALDVPDLQPRETLLPRGAGELSQPAMPGWATAPVPMRRAMAMQIVGGLAQTEPLTVRVAMPDAPGYRLIFAHLQRDWRAIGVVAERVADNDRSANLRLIDVVAPIELASWYLRHFTCETVYICDPAADEMMQAARIAPTPANRQALLANADRILTDAVPFIALTAPVRWSLVSPRLTGFRTNSFAQHNLGELIAATP